MKTIAVIAEYNPFHNGHAYQLNTLRRELNADGVIVIMSGNFVERGEPALIEKAVRTEMALKNGADLVLELPVLYATASAEDFAMGAVACLNALGCVDTLVFGAEEENLSLLYEIAQILANEPGEYKALLQKEIKAGCSYPLASSRALTEYMKLPTLEEILSRPNNILAIQYCKALIRLNSSMKPYLIKRKGADYHAKEITQQSDFSSATAIREILMNISEREFPSFADLKIPKSAHSLLQQEWEKKRVLFPDSLSPILHSKLLTEKTIGFEKYMDISKELSDKIIKNLNSFVSFSQFCELLKSKEFTYLRIRRSLLHIYLGITKDLYTEAKENGYAFYVRPLGFQSAGKKIFSEIAAHSQIPLISKLADMNIVLSQYPNSEISQKVLELDILASALYESLLTVQTGKPIQNEYTKKLVMLP